MTDTRPDDKTAESRHKYEEHGMDPCSQTAFHMTMTPNTVSSLELMAERETVRTKGLTSIRKSLVLSTSNSLSVFQVESLFKQQEFCSLLFKLFDHEGRGFLDQKNWICHLRSLCDSDGLAESPATYFDSTLVSDLVDLLDTLAYNICQDYNITQEYFHKIWSCPWVVQKLLLCIDKNKDVVFTVDEFMAFIVAITMRINESTALSKENIIWLEEVFRKNLASGQTEFTLDEFKNIVPSKNDFFVEGVFRIFDKDCSGTVSLEEFLETMHQFAKQGDEEKLSFLFKVYDNNGDGLIDSVELKEILRSCVEESRMKFDAKQVDDMAEALYQAAVMEGKLGISVADLRDQFLKQPGLLENLASSLGKWLLPPKPQSEKPWRKKVVDKIRLKMNHIRKNAPFFVFLGIIIFINLVLFVQRLIFFRSFPMLDGVTANVFHIIATACGRALLFNNVLVLVLVLRCSITHLRNLGMASVLPLDSHIHLHKLVGWMIFAQSWLHTLMHLINLKLNIQPDPVKFLQLTQVYRGDWTQLGYTLPPGCVLVTRNSNLSRFCDAQSVESTWANITHCQSCPPPSLPWSYTTWLFSSSPGMFGLVGGWANPTGVLLIIVLTIMVVFAMNFVRRSGYFKVFFFTHLNYVLFWILLLLHSQYFWKLFSLFGCIWLAETAYRVVSVYRSKPVLADATPMASRVTRLTMKIRNMSTFHYKPGDWVLIKVPEIAMFEWHPFSISSAPDATDTFTVHVRGVGHWTNKLYDYFQHKSDLRRQLVDSVTQAGDSEVGGQELLERPVKIFVDGPFSAPSSDIFRAEHAVLVGTGIGVTPFAAILQSIMDRYNQANVCPNCDYHWSSNNGSIMKNLRKVDFFWINRDQASFEWFVDLLSQLETTQAEVASRFLDLHMYVTSARHMTDMEVVLLQMAMDLIYQKDKRDLLTGLKARTNAGRPNWNKVFTRVKEQRAGNVTVFFCGNSNLARILKKKCAEFGFTFRKEVY